MDEVGTVSGNEEVWKQRKMREVDKISGTKIKKNEWRESSENEGIGSKEK